MKQLLSNDSADIARFNSVMRAQFPSLCLRMTTQFSDISVNIGNIQSIFDKIIDYYIQLLNRNDLQNNLLKCIKSCKDISKRIQLLEKEKLVLVSAIWLDQCRQVCLNITSHNGDTNNEYEQLQSSPQQQQQQQQQQQLPQGTVLMSIEDSLSNSNSQLQHIQQQINEWMEELMSEKHNLMEIERGEI